MIHFSEETDRLEYLDGKEVVDLGEGITLGGCGAWYDGSYGIKNLDLSERAIRCAWLGFTDNRYIEMRGFDIFEYAYSQKRLLQNIASKCSVILTHVAPESDPKMPDKYKNIWSSFFSFDGSKVLNSMREGSVWVFGHTHTEQDYLWQNKVHMLCNPLKYPEEDISKGVLSKIKKFNIIKESL